MRRRSLVSATWGGSAFCCAHTSVTPGGYGLSARIGVDVPIPPRACVRPGFAPEEHAWRVECRVPITNAGMTSSGPASMWRMNRERQSSWAPCVASSRVRRTSPTASGLAVLLLLLGCDRVDETSVPEAKHGGAADAPPSSGGSSAGGSSSGGSSNGDSAAEGSTTGAASDATAAVNEPSPADAALDPAAGEGTAGSADAVADDGSGEPEKLVTMGTTREDAIAILAEQGALPDDARIESCEFRKGGKPLGDAGRVDVVECVFSDGMAYVSAAWMVIRPSTLYDALVVEELTSVTEVPGETGSYILGGLVLRNGTISIRVKEKWTTYGNTGDPDAPPDKSIERVQKDFVCMAVEDYWECNRTVAP